MSGPFFDFLPKEAKDALTQKATDASWVSWNDRIEGLARWRQKRAKEAPAKQADDQRLRHLVSFAGLSFGDVIDIGCAGGRLKEYLPDAVSYTGIEPNPTPQTDPSRIVRGVAESLPFLDESFDFATMLSVFDYFVDPAKSLEEAARVLRPRGKLAMIVTIRPQRVADLFHSGRLASLYKGLHPEVLRALGVKGTLSLILDNFISKRKLHMSYFSDNDVLRYTEGRFQLEAREQQGSVLFLLLTKR